MIVALYQQGGFAIGGDIGDAAGSGGDDGDAGSVAFQDGERHVVDIGTGYVDIGFVVELGHAILRNHAGEAHVSEAEIAYHLFQLRAQGTVVGERESGLGIAPLHDLKRAQSTSDVIERLHGAVVQEDGRQRGALAVAVPGGVNDIENGLGLQAEPGEHVHQVGGRCDHSSRHANEGLRAAPTGQMAFRAAVMVVQHGGDAGEAAQDQRRGGRPEEGEVGSREDMDDVVAADAPGEFGGEPGGVYDGAQVLDGANPAERPGERLVDGKEIDADGRLQAEPFKKLGSLNRVAAHDLEGGGDHQHANGFR